MPQDDFYIGYLDKAPEGLAKWLRGRVVGLIVVALGVAVMLVAGQKAFYPSTFEFLQYRSFEGVVEEHPYPMLRVMHPGESGELPYSRYYLVQEGKFGAQHSMEGFEGQRVRFEGTLIYRDDQVMIELKPGTVEVVDAERAQPDARLVLLGQYTLTGEIVDSKCYLGVMNPSSEKPHRACAARCISGGIPPLFITRNESGDTSYLLLQSPEGEAVNAAVLDVVAEPLSITGSVYQQGDLLVFQADPATFRRLNP